MAVAVFAGIIAFAEPIESAVDSRTSIPPTPAVKTVNVDTTPFAGVTTNVTTTTHDDIIYFVSDGSIWFNVTDTAP